MLAADQYTPVDETMIPTGEIKPVQGTPLDFTTPTPIGARIDQLKGDPGGYDHNYVLRGDGKTPPWRPGSTSPRAARVLEMFTTEPGVQLYTANFLDGTLKGKGGVVYKKHQAFCLEAQHFPDSVHHANFPSTILRPGENLYPDDDLQVLCQLIQNGEPEGVSPRNESEPEGVSPRSWPENEGKMDPNMGLCFILHP